MAEFDGNADADARREGWNGFVKMSTIATVGVVAILVLMAIFLL